MRYHAMSFEDPAQRVAQARAILDFLARSVRTENNAYGMLLQSELQGLQRAADYYILHEHLEDINEPIYFHEFAERAARHGLLYLGEADFSAMLTSNFSPEVHETLLRVAPDLIRQEQYMDFLRNRTFRQTLLVRDGAPVQRSVGPQRIHDLWIASPLRPVQEPPDLAADVPQSYRAPDGGTLATPNAVTKAAMGLLAERWPAAIAFGDLLRDSLARLQPLGIRAGAPGLGADETLASDVLQCQAAGLVELRTRPSDFVVTPGSHPQASALARWQAQQGLQSVTSLRHETVAIDQTVGRLLPLLDGSRDRATICRHAATLAAGRPGAGMLPVKDVTRRVTEQVDRMLENLARAALLQA
jgi:methyltransferase-like protein